jgi:hypothetical protein
MRMALQQFLIDRALFSRKTGDPKVLRRIVANLRRRVRARRGSTIGSRGGRGGAEAGAEGTGVDDHVEVGSGVVCEILFRRIRSVIGWVWMNNARRERHKAGRRWNWNWSGCLIGKNRAEQRIH